MVGRIFRVLLGLFLLPACYALSRSFVQVLAHSNAAILESCCLFGGIAFFLLCWFVLPHPVKTYVFGHELTHALWGLLFFARPSKLRVGEKGGSVNLTKTNFLITLAPYFFPFYTFVVILAALVTGIFVKPLPVIPVWMFFIGATWAFHILFTFESLGQHQPDITLYGRVFSWTFIFFANVILVLVWLAAVTSTFAFAIDSVASCMSEAYIWVYDQIRYLVSLFI